MVSWRYLPPAMHMAEGILHPRCFRVCQLRASTQLKPPCPCPPSHSPHTLSHTHKRTHTPQGGSRAARGCACRRHQPRIRPAAGHAGGGDGGALHARLRSLRGPDPHPHAGGLDCLQRQWQSWHSGLCELIAVSLVSWAGRGWRQVQAAVHAAACAQPGCRSGRRALRCCRHVAGPLLTQHVAPRQPSFCMFVPPRTVAGQEPGGLAQRLWRRRERRRAGQPRRAAAAGGAPRGLPAPAADAARRARPASWRLGTAVPQGEAGQRRGTCAQVQVGHPDSIQAAVNSYLRALRGQLPVASRVWIHKQAPAAGAQPCRR